MERRKSEKKRERKEEREYHLPIERREFYYTTQSINSAHFWRDGSIRRREKLDRRRKG